MNSTIFGLDLSIGVWALLSELDKQKLEEMLRMSDSPYDMGSKQTSAHLTIGVTVHTDFLLLKKNKSHVEQGVLSLNESRYAWRIDAIVEKSAEWR